MPITKEMIEKAKEELNQEFTKTGLYDGEERDKLQEEIYLKLDIIDAAEWALYHGYRSG